MPPSTMSVVNGEITCDPAGATSFIPDTTKPLELSIDGSTVMAITGPISGMSRN